MKVKSYLGQERAHLEADTEQRVEFEGDIVAEIAKGADLGFMIGDGGRDGLLGLSVDEFAKVERSLVC